MYWWPTCNEAASVADHHRIGTLSTAAVCQHCGRLVRWGRKVGPWDPISGQSISYAAFVHVETDDVACPAVTA